MHSILPWTPSTAQPISVQVLPHGPIASQSVPIIHPMGTVSQYPGSILHRPTAWPIGAQHPPHGPAAQMICVQDPSPCMHCVPQPITTQTPAQTCSTTQPVSRIPHGHSTLLSQSMPKISLYTPHQSAARIHPLPSQSAPRRPPMPPPHPPTPSLSQFPPAKGWGAPWG